MSSSKPYPILLNCLSITRAHISVSKIGNQHNVTLIIKASSKELQAMLPNTGYSSSFFFRMKVFVLIRGWIFWMLLYYYYFSP